MYARLLADLGVIVIFHVSLFVTAETRYRLERVADSDGLPSLCSGGLKFLPDPQKRAKWTSVLGDFTSQIYSK